MAKFLTTRFGLQRWTAVDGSDQQQRSEFDNDNSQIETLAALYGQGTLAAKGAASSANQGKFWMITDATGGGVIGQFYYSDGTTWRGPYADKASADAAYLASGGGTLTGELVLPDLKVTGLTGSTSASRYVGATASGAPASGAHLLGDWVIDLTGKIFICTTAGTPGAWTQAGGSAVNPATLGLFPPGPGLAPNPSAAFSPIASYAIYSKFKPLADITVTSIRYGVVSANANLDVGIYADSAGAPGARLVSSGSFAMSGALSAKTISSTTLTAGTPYWLAIASDSTVATFIVHQIIASQSAMNPTVVMQSAALPLPATASAGTAVSSVVPMLYILT